MKRFLQEYFLPYLIAPIYWLFTRTWRFEESGPESVLQNYVRERKPCLYAHWHGDELVLIGYYSYRRLAVLSSLSKDGSIMARTLSLLGYQVFRGSSSKGGARGLIGLIRAVKKDSQAALAVDGPKGPIYMVKPGIVELAWKTGAPIVPIRTFSKYAWFIPRTWNKCYVPKPFTKVEVKYGEAIFSEEPDSKMRDASITAICEKVKLALESLS